MLKNLHNNVQSKIRKATRKLDGTVVNVMNGFTDQVKDKLTKEDSGAFLSPPEMAGVPTFLHGDTSVNAAAAAAVSLADRNILKDSSIMEESERGSDPSTIQPALDPRQFAAPSYSFDSHTTQSSSGSTPPWWLGADYVCVTIKEARNVGCATWQRDGDMLQCINSSTHYV